MAKTVHGRKVLNMVLESGQPYNRDALKDAMATQFGQDVQYHTCSVQELSADGLIDLFLGKGKLVETDFGIIGDASKQCGHH
ncbi:MAG: hypothetical protein B0D91_09855 [Oceanospirillales bacterium LUC14_002_19_P2]|nr:MAG: hypothetical protein B0D91_09855 [Oceanospirillales bacterium LUC14_002_19_P2]